MAERDHIVRIDGERWPRGIDGGGWWRWTSWCGESGKREHIKEIAVNE